MLKIFLIWKLLKQYKYHVIINVNNNYQRNLEVLYTFVFNKSFGQLLSISPKNFIFLKTFNSEFSYIEVWFTDQSSNPLDIEDVTLVID